MKHGRTDRDIETDLNTLLAALREHHDNVRGWRRQLLLEVIALRAAEHLGARPHTEGGLAIG